jgi:signal transduction histidine kinase
VRARRSDLDAGVSGTPADLERLQRRLTRESRARQEAETIAERVTADLYATSRKLEDANAELHRTNDALQALNQTMRDFVAVASHDLRSPLTAILGFTAALTQYWDQFENAQKRDFIGSIQRQSESLSRMVEDLLTVSKIEAGALDVHRDVVGLREALADLIDTFQARAAEVAITSSPALAVAVDRDHLRRILVNFVGNALKYGAPPVAVEARLRDEWIEIRVRDCGNGVPEEFRPRLFGRFARSDAARASSVAGTGLGLSIVRGLARANGGDVWYEPNEPHGSVFGVRLPASVP